VLEELKMRKLFAVGALALLVIVPAPRTEAQPGIPRGSFQRSCRDIQVNGQFLSAWCQGSRGSGQSSINIQSCSGDIGVDASGALVCAGPGGGRPPPGPVFPPPGPGPGRPPPPGPGFRPPPGGGGFGIVLFGQRGFRGPSVRIDRDVSNLANTGMNDRTRSIQLDRRSGPWIVCTDANFRGRCTTIDRNVDDTGRIGMLDSISSLRRR
jgi:hypothetical protein